MRQQDLNNLLILSSSLFGHRDFADAFRFFFNAWFILLSTLLLPSGLCVFVIACVAYFT